MLDELDAVTRARLKDGIWNISLAGNLFKRSWFEEVDILPMGRRMVRYWDCAASSVNALKKRDDPDYTAGLKLSEHNGIFYIEDIEAFRGKPEEVERRQKTCMVNDGSGVAIREEQEPGASGIAVIDQKARTIFFGKNYKGDRPSGNKIDRAAPVSAAAERGQIKYKRGCRNIELFFEQAEAFPAEGWGIHNKQNCCV